MENIKNLFRLYFRPSGAMSEIIDKGSWLFAAALVLLVAFAFYSTVHAPLDAAYRVPNFQEFYQPDALASSADDEEEWAAAAAEHRKKALAEYQRAMSERQKVPLLGDYFFRFFSFESDRFYHPLVSLSIFYVPFAIFLLSVFGGAGVSFGAALRRDYGTLSVCTLMAWAAGHLPFAIAGILFRAAAATEIPPPVYFGLWAAGGLLFGIFMVFALRTVFGADYKIAVLVVSLAWLGLTAGMYVLQVVSPWLFSPFLLFFAYIYFGGQIGGEVRGFGDAFRQKQNFKRFLHNATVNPRDADAHVQLALIYLQRRQETRALEHLKKAVEIDPQEIDANYELGKMARARGELQGAINHFSVVVEQNDKFALSEVWREIGATYLEADMLGAAREALEKFVERRPVDAEGLYYLGKVLKAQGEGERAREMFEQAVESVKTSPYYRRFEQRKWAGLAQKQLS